MSTLQAPRGVRSHSEALRRLLGRGSVFTLGTAIQMSTALLVVPVITRILDPAQYGVIAAAVVVATLVSMAGAFGLPEAATREFFQGADGPARAHRLVVAALGVAGLTAAIVHLTGPLWAPLFSLEYGGALTWAVLAGFAGAVLLATQALLRAADRVWTFLAVVAVASVGGQGCAVVLALALGTPGAYVAGLAAGTGAAALVGLLATRSPRHGLPALAELRAGARVGMPLVPHSLAQYLIASADRVAIAAILGLAAAGRYQVAYAVGSLGVALVMALNQAWLPLLLGLEERDRPGYLAATSRAVHALSAAVVAALALAAPVALALAAPASFAPDELVPVSAIVSVSMLAYATASAHFHLVFMRGRTAVMAMAAPMGALANIALNALLLPAVGLVGAALATVAAYALLTLAAVLAVRRQRAVIPGMLRTSLGWWAGALPYVIAGAYLPGTPAGIAVRILLGLTLASAALVAIARLRGGRAGVIRDERPANGPLPTTVHAR